MDQLPVSGIKPLSMLHFSLLIGQLVFAAIAYYLVYTGSMGKLDVGENFQFVLIGIAIFSIIMVVLAFSMYNKKIVVLTNSSQSLNDKLIAYRAANLIRWAMLEAPALLAIIAFMLMGNYYFLLIAATIFLLFIMTRPTAAKAAAEMSISEDEAG